MHYYNGKPVAADYNGGVNVIHSHKHCTEWSVIFSHDGWLTIVKFKLLSPISVDLLNFGCYLIEGPLMYTLKMIQP